MITRTRSKLILAVVISFFVFQLYMFLKSFPAEYRIYLRYLERVQVNDPFWTTFWFASELVGEVGLIIRFAGACFALALAVLLVKKGKVIFSHLRKSLLGEGAYYLFIIPFIVSLFARPNTTSVNLLAGLSYTLQIVLVTPAFFILYTKLKRATMDSVELCKWGAIAVVGYVFALWVKHFLLQLYALPINFGEPVLLLGFLNSALTMLFAGLLLSIAFLPLIRREKLGFNSKLAGVAFVLVGAYFLVYMVVSLFNQRYLSFLGLTELWAVAFLIMGVGFLAEKGN